MTALIFDCDGVLADTELQGHLPAFNATFAEAGLPVQWGQDEYVALLHIGGGKERMATALAPVLTARGLGSVDERAALIADLHARKTERYTTLVRSGAVPPRPGVRRLAEEADAAGWQLAVASTSAEASVRAVLATAVGPDLAARFEVFAGDAVARKKPAPDIYLLALERLGIGAHDAVVVEDSQIGLRAARAAGLATVVTVGPSTAHDDFTGAQLLVTSLGEPGTPADVLADPLDLGVDGVVDLGVLQRLLTATAR